MVSRTVCSIAANIASDRPVCGYVQAVGGVAVGAVAVGAVADRVQIFGKRAECAGANGDVA